MGGKRGHQSRQEFPKLKKEFLQRRAAYTRGTGR